jgi:ribonuclease HI
MGCYTIVRGSLGSATTLLRVPPGDGGVILPFGEIVQNKEASSRVAKWEVKLMGETLSFTPRKAIKY